MYYIEWFGNDNVGPGVKQFKLKCQLPISYVKFWDFIFCPFSCLIYREVDLLVRIKQDHECSDQDYSSCVSCFNIHKLRYQENLTHLDSLVLTNEKAETFQRAELEGKVSHPVLHCYALYFSPKNKPKLGMES